jgi:hypothetical protein
MGYALSISEVELKAHLQDAGGWNGVHEIFLAMSRILYEEMDGTNNEIVGDDLVLFSEPRKVGPRDVKGKERE